MFEFVPQILRKAATIMLSAHDTTGTVSEKSGDANFVTKYDVAVEDFLRAEFKKAIPEAVFIGEEGGGESATDSALCIVADPIDGTTNFIFDYHRSAISVGICRANTVLYGAVYDPYLGRLYHAERGCGAFVEADGYDLPIRVSSLPLDRSLVSFGTTPYSKEKFAEATFRSAQALFTAALDLRRSGSAALDLCDVACGKIGFFFEYSLSPWDYAAASVIIEEAGGIITQFNGSPIDLKSPCSIAAGNKTAYSKGVGLL